MLERIELTPEEAEIIKRCAREIIKLPHSISCSICTKEFCRDDKNMSCVDCVEHYLKLHTTDS